MSIAVLAGLGNPGREYTDTRHNVGFRLIDTLATRHGGLWKLEPRFKSEIAQVLLDGRKAWLVKPQTFMNDSGMSLGPFLKFHKLPSASLVAIYDDITLNPGRLKISLTGSDGGHNGVKSLLSHVGEGFVRFRIGIGPKAVKAMDLKDHVLGKFSHRDQATIDGLLPELTDALELLFARGADAAMNELNPKFKQTPSSI
ncbi:MAG: aminoacyl-tRNA hydrolase [Opitutales bacterium]